MTHRFTNPVTRYRAAYASRTEPESAALISRGAWRLFLAITALFMIGAIVLSIVDLSATLSVLDQDGGSSKVKIPTIDRSRLNSVAEAERRAVDVFLEKKSAPAAATDPSL